MGLCCWNLKQDICDIHILLQIQRSFHWIILLNTSFIENFSKYWTLFWQSGDNTLFSLKILSLNQFEMKFFPNSTIWKPSTDRFAGKFWICIIYNELVFRIIVWIVNSVVVMHHQRNLNKYSRSQYVGPPCAPLSGRHSTNGFSCFACGRRLLETDSLLLSASATPCCRRNTCWLHLRMCVCACVRVCVILVLCVWMTVFLRSAHFTRVTLTLSGGNRPKLLFPTIINFCCVIFLVVGRNCCVAIFLPLMSLFALICNNKKL